MNKQAKKSANKAESVWSNGNDENEHTNGSTNKGGSYERGQNDRGGDRG